MNQRRHAKAFPLAATLIIIALAICFVTFAIKALMVKYQLVQGGSKIKELERELTALALSNQSLQTKKERLISAPELKKQLEIGHLKGLVPIKDGSVIPVMPPALPRPAQSAVAAANVTFRLEEQR
jgi:hypothetical protein